MTYLCKKIGILGGTFNPIHCGHLKVAEAVRVSFGLDKVLFVPSGKPPHKLNKEVTGAEHRYAMVECAVRSNPYFEASRVEIDRMGYTYTVDTLRLLRSLYCEGTELYFLIGSDVIDELKTWKNFREVFKLCSFIAVERPGCDREYTSNRIEQLRKQYDVTILKVEAPLVDISSTLIREFIKEKSSIKYLVPECVEEYINKNGLYR